MNFKISFLACLLFSLVLIFGCNNDDVSPTFSLSLSGLEDLGPDYVYEGWLIVNGSAITTGVFTIDANGNMSQNSFSVDSEDLSLATTFVLTIEPANDPDPTPTDIHILAGDFDANTANLNISHPAALGDNFINVIGNYILATPTDGSDNNELSGLWFLDLSSGSPQVGLVLPALPAGWAYEGWAVVGGQPVSTGTFISPTQSDASAIYSGSMPAPPFPGEDFIINAPSGLTFPTNLSGGLAVISIEPVPDNSPLPFALKPLVGNIPSDAMDHQTYTMNSNLAFPTGSVSR